jgi:hypothetical protein
MANSVQILDKIARNAEMILGASEVTRGASSVVIENGGNDLTVTYVDATHQAPMGGVSGSSSPFLGIGVGAPGVIQIQGAAGAGWAATVDTAVVLKLLAICMAFGNDVVVKGSTGTELVRLRGHVDHVGLGM